MTNSEYIKWMYDPSNECNCEECPENRQYDDWEGKLPCGQQNCWVTAHLRSLES